VLHSVRSWAFLPDTHAAEAAAEATAMASFTAGSSSSNPHGTNSMTGLLASNASSAAAAGGLFAAAASAFGAATAQSAGAVGQRITTGGSSSRAWTGSKAAEAAMRQCLQQAWLSVCSRLPRCPSFLAHIQGPAGVAGMQLHLLQLLGGPGQALAERLGWLAELEQQEILEAVATHSAAAAGPRQPATAAAGFMGLLCDRGAGGLGVSASVGPNGQNLTCNLSMQQLKQVGAATSFAVCIFQLQAQCCVTIRPVVTCCSAAHRLLDLQTGRIVLCQEACKYVCTVIECAARVVRCCSVWPLPRTTTQRGRQRWTSCCRTWPSAGQPQSRHTSCG
jgi:hypothetical protein